MPRYGMTLRPPGYGGVPIGVSWHYVEAPTVRLLAQYRKPGSVEELPQGRYPHGTIETSRELTAAELSHFDIVKVEG